jgi:acyl phosphate:glycerol-3-phosphate acyltransferase
MISLGWLYFLTALCGYLIGSIPNGYLVGRARGIDVRERGSGNIGATNVLRVVGKKWGYLVFTLDAMKGFLAARLGFAFPLVGSSSIQPDILGIIGGLACILGHTFPMWLRFRGGKGVATSAGVLLGLMPIAVLSVFVVWALLFQLTRYVSVASISAAVALPLFVALYLHLGALAGGSLLPFSIIIAAVVIWRHRSNMQRLFLGKEQRFDEK